MATKIFVNLPVKDIKKTTDFFKKLGFEFNPQFTNEKAACLIISENIFTMLVLEPHFKTFTKKEICNTKKNTEVIIAVEVDSRKKVDEIVKKAIENGGSIYKDLEDYGWMYGCSFADLDGHQWEVFYMSKDPLNKK